MFNYTMLLGLAMIVVLIPPLPPTSPLLWGSVVGRVVGGWPTSPAPAVDRPMDLLTWAHDCIIYQQYVSATVRAGSSLTFLRTNTVPVPRHAPPAPPGVV